MPGALYSFTHILSIACALAHSLSIFLQLARNRAYLHTHAHTHTHTHRDEDDLMPPPLYAQLHLVPCFMVILSCLCDLVLAIHYCLLPLINCLFRLKQLSCLLLYQYSTESHFPPIKYFKCLHFSGCFMKCYRLCSDIVVL